MQFEEFEEDATIYKMVEAGELSDDELTFDKKKAESDEDDDDKDEYDKFAEILDEYEEEEGQDAS